MNGDSAVREEVDLVVVGGGPAGSTIASLVAMQGHRVILLEKENFPRYQIGESLLPGTIHGICKLLGVTEELAQQSFPVKRGGVFKWGVNPTPWKFNFALSPNFPAPTSTAYQVERMKFDDILLRNARRLGVDAREGATVIDIVEDGDRVHGVRYVDESGVERVIESKFVADASGNTSRIHGKIGGERHYSDFFKNIATFGYFENGKRLPEPYSGNILCAAFDEGWCWYIPLSDTLTSVGAVIGREHAAQLRGDSETALMGLLDRCDIVKDFLSDATRVTDGVYGEIRTRKDYSYSQSEFWRPGMFLVGDAACFIDPVFSTGVHLATYSALLAARSVNSVLSGDLSEQVAFTEFDRRYRREYRTFYEFLASFYDMQVDENSYFWQARKVTNMKATDVEAFTTLVAGGHSGEAALTDAEGIVAEFESSTELLNGAVNDTWEMQSSGNEGMGRLFDPPVVRGLMDGSNQMLTKDSLGGRVPEVPLFEDGLVPSADSLRWVVPVPDAPAAGVR
ncbi:tryptophan 7-halogenase [Tsukamurella sp. 8F]|uniref:tryptophan 7-halogenase n=1 Tax=unclassified Tsukamurella TaxID=2633480 RepID=UPI0023B9A309|nr:MULTISPECIES: tryptophan 7-halogenase [unclassified Tsukamurella]MDF0531176.1 tryptophan 7-halogenase [Tsukamurella sp. 8J]MDF0585877.1 tryptophan 7-halogenase [Tsukamurella sp. 8F]